MKPSSRAKGKWHDLDNRLRTRHRINALISQLHKMKTPHVCAMCDCHHDVEDSYFSLNGAGPFCNECWQSLTDADQSLLLDKRLADAEDKIEELQNQIKFLMQ
jgi:hypothetical protein